MTAEKKVGLFFVVGLLIMLVLSMTVEDLSLPFFRQEYQLVAYFKEIGDLRVGNTVTVSGMPVGRIKNFQLERNEILVRFSVRDEYKIPVDSEAEIVLSSLLGGNQLNISLGKSRNYFRDGQEIEVREMISVGDIVNSFSDVSASVQNLAANVDKNQEAFFQRIRFFMDENEEKVATIISNFQEASENMNDAFARMDKTIGNIDTISDNFLIVSDNLAQGKGTMGKLIHDESLYDNLQEVSGDIREMMFSLQSQDSLLGKLIYSEEMGEDFEVTINNVRHVSEDLQNILAERGDEIDEIIVNLHASSHSLNTITRNLVVLSEKMERGEGTLGKMLSDEELYYEIRLLVTQLQQAVRNVEETVINNSVFSVFMSGVR